MVHVRARRMVFASQEDSAVGCAVEFDGVLARMLRGYFGMGACWACGFGVVSGRCGRWLTWSRSRHGSGRDAGLGGTQTEKWKAGEAGLVLMISGAGDKMRD